MAVGDQIRALVATEPPNAHRTRQAIAPLGQGELSLDLGNQGSGHADPSVHHASRLD